MGDCLFSNKTMLTKLVVDAADLKKSLISHKWEGGLKICSDFDGCPLSWSYAKGDSDGGAASPDGIAGRPGAPVTLAGSYRGTYNMGPLTEHTDPYYVY